MTQPDGSWVAPNARPLGDLERSTPDVVVVAVPVDVDRVPCPVTGHAAGLTCSLASGHAGVHQSTDGTVFTP